MENAMNLRLIDESVRAFVSAAGVLLAVSRFLFLTVCGWIILATLLVLTLISRSKNRDGEMSLSGFVGALAETSFWFYSHLTSILFGAVLVVFMAFAYGSLKNISESLSLYREIKTLEAALRNLKTERKLLEAQVVSFDDGGTAKLRARVRYFAYSPVKNADIVSGEAEYIIEGRRAYFDFGLMNFDYALIESGLAKNVAYPYRLFSDTVAPREGVSLLTGSDGFPLSFKLDGEHLYLMDTDSFKAELSRLLDASTNSAKARKTGIRARYGEAVSVPADTGRVFRFHSTGTGGIVLR